MRWREQRRRGRASACSTYEHKQNVMNIALPVVMVKEQCALPCHLNPACMSSAGNASPLVHNGVGVPPPPRAGPGGSTEGVRLPSALRITGASDGPMQTPITMKEPGYILLQLPTRTDRYASSPNAVSTRFANACKWASAS
jgi:hypothetical protein